MSRDSKGHAIEAPVFYSAVIAIALLVFSSVLFPEASTDFFKALQGGIVNIAGWFYVLAVAIILVTVLYFGISETGDIKLGPDHSQADYSYLTWFAMLFSAGMGIGLMFFGVAEPVMHFTAPPHGEPETLHAAREAMQLTFFHWGLHAWAIYAIVGLILAYFSFRQGMPLTLRSALYPLIGAKANGPIGYSIDVFAIIGTVVGVATSLGYGVSQINAGLKHLFGIPESLFAQIVIVIVVTGFALASVLSGLNKGIRRLSEVNMILAVLLLCTILLLGPTVFLIQMYVQNTGHYISDIVGKTFNLYAYDPTDWLGGWTILYWGWWISWSPFVGMFIARISRGRTIREFCFGVLLVPAGFTLLWMTIFGNSAIDLIMNQGQAVLARAVEDNNALALFKFLEYYPFSEVLSVIAIVMVVIFFVTSADSGALVVNMLSSGGIDDTPAWQRIFWTSMIGLVAGILLVAGGLAALQTATIASALPFTALLLWMMLGLKRSLDIDLLKRQSLKFKQNGQPAAGVAENNKSWKDRIDNIVNTPRAKTVKHYIDRVVKAAFEEVATALRDKGLEARVEGDDEHLYLEVFHDNEIDFRYAVRMRQYSPPAFTLSTLNQTEDQHADTYYRAEVFLIEGGQNYDVMGYSHDHLINDVLDQYEKHIHFLSLVK